jgi:hypothetical protein
METIKNLKLNEANNNLVEITLEIKKIFSKEQLANQREFLTNELNKVNESLKLFDVQDVVK